MNFFKYDWQKLDKSTVNNCFYDCKFYFIDFQTSSVILFEHRQPASLHISYLKTFTKRKEVDFQAKSQQKCPKT